MPFIFKPLLDHGTTNPIVARLSVQILKILDYCNLTQETRDRIGEIYLYSLQKKLLRCWEIKERLLESLRVAQKTYKLPSGQERAINLPQIARLEEECHNFLYEAKNYIRDLLKVVNILYKADFKEASEFLRAKKGRQSLIDFAIRTFGEHDARTRFLREAASTVEYFIDFRNAVEHPGGYSGELRIENISLDPDGKTAEPTWWREKNGQRVDAPSSIRADMETGIHNLLASGESMIVFWAMDHLMAPALMRIRQIPAKQRNPKCPIKWDVTPSQHLEKLLKSQANKREAAPPAGERP